jgi:hypothetical protein
MAESVPVTWKYEGSHVAIVRRSSHRWFCHTCVVPESVKQQKAAVMALRLWRAVGVSLIMQALCAIVASASCPGADPNDWIPDDAALQACIDAGETLYLDPGSPGYIVNSGLALNTDNIIITSSGAPGTRARIMAGRDLNENIISTTPRPVYGFQISYISFDGMVHDNTPWRLHRDECAGSHTPGNIAVQGNAFTIAHNESVHAMCRSGMIVLGSGFEVYDNYVAYNGRDQFDPAPGAHWADGITALNCSSSSIHDNTAVDNTDVDIVEDGDHCLVYNNAIFNGGAYAFAGLQVGYFGRGNHVGSEYWGNRIHGDADNRLGIGLLVGFHPWDANIWLTCAGYVHDNVIDGAGINLQIEGINAGTIVNNSMSNPRGTWAGPDCQIGPINYAAWHFGSATFQDGWNAVLHDGGTPCIINP